MVENYKEDIKMKKVFWFILTAVLTAFVSCQKQGPAEPVWVEIPYSVSTDITKVTYNNGYSQKAGDKLRVRGVTREDISGILEYNSGVGQWEGNLRYLESEGEPAVGTELTVTLVHADNDDESTYAHGCLGVSTLAEAAEKLSLLTGSTTFGSTGTVTLTQQATFVQVTVSFDFLGTGTMVTGETSVDVTVGGDHIASGTVEIANVAASGDPDYEAYFFMALPGGTEITENDYIEICDRKAFLRNSGASSVTLAANKKYTMARTVQFKPELGDPYWSDGTYGRIAHPAGIDIVGIIVYVNKDDSAESLAVTESTHGGGHALVMALHNASSGDKWTSINAEALTPLVTTPAEAVAISNVSGFSNTQAQAGKRAPDYALNYRSGEGDDHTNDTGWFLPSVGQWIYSLSDFASVDPMENWFNREGKNWITLGKFNDLVFVKEGPADANLLIESLNNRFEVLQNHLGCTYDTFGILVWDGTVNKYVFSDSYWTSTENSDSQAVRFNLGSVEQKNSKYYSTLKVAAIAKNSTFAWKQECPLKVRPFLAF